MSRWTPTEKELVRQCAARVRAKDVSLYKAVNTICLKVKNKHTRLAVYSKLYDEVHLDNLDLLARYSGKG